MKNFVEKGNRMALVNSGAAIASGDVVIIGSIIGIAETDIAATTGVGTICTEGVFQLGKTASLAIAQGDRVFFNTSTKLITKTATDTPIGTAFESADAADSTVNVNIYENAPEGFPVAATVAAVSAAAATDLGTTETLANANKAAINAILVSLKAAGIMA